MYVSELSRFLKVDKDAKLVAEILMEILASLHCDQKLVSHSHWVVLGFLSENCIAS